MKKRFGLAVVMAGALLGIHCSKGDIPSGTGLVKVADNVYAFIAGGPSAAEGLGANSGFVVGRDAVMVIDSRQTPELAGTLYEAIRTVTDLPVKYVVNTHYHPDHTWGNSVFRDRGAVIIARPETRDAIEKYTPVYMEYYRDQKPETWRSRVDFPEPDAPIRATISPGCSSSFTSESALCAPPKDLLRPSTDNDAPLAIGSALPRFFSAV